MLKSKPLRGKCVRAQKKYKNVNSQPLLKIVKAKI